MWCTLCDCTHDECNNSQIHASIDYTIILKLFVHQSQRQSQNHESAICGVRVDPHIKTTTFLVEFHFHLNNLFLKNQRIKIIIKKAKLVIVSAILG